VAFRPADADGSGYSPHQARNLSQMRIVGMRPNVT
jgi:hypothetical protein